MRQGLSVDNEIKSQFALLSREEQHIAEVILDDILSGELRDFDPDKSFFEYIADYTCKQLMKNIRIFCDAFGYDPNKLYKIISYHLNEENLYQGGLYDEILLDLDKEKAKEVMESIEGIEIKSHRVKLKAQEYLKRFILSEGRLWR